MPSVFVFYPPLFTALTTFTLVFIHVQLGVAVFSSGPFKESELFQNKALLAALDECPELANVHG